MILGCAVCADCLTWLRVSSFTTHAPEIHCGDKRRQSSNPVAAHIPRNAEQRAVESRSDLQHEAVLGWRISQADSRGVNYTHLTVDFQ
jgi:hypothetical protein